MNSSIAATQSDIFSLGAVLYYLLNIDKGEEAFLMKMTDQYSTSQYSKAIDSMKKNLITKCATMPYALRSLFQSVLDSDMQSRGSVNSFVENAFFQDPLIKTIKYLENIEQKEHHNIVQFLTGLTRIMDKFDRRTCVRKIIPLMLKCVDKGDLSVMILPSVMKLLNQKDFIDKDAFRTYVWPPIANLCKAGEMPAQALYLLVDNTELFSGYVNAGDFQNVYLPLILKSLE